MKTYRTPLSVGEEEIESVNEFPYLGLQIESSGRVMLDVERQIAQASKAFGALNEISLFGPRPEGHHKTQSVPSLHAVCTPLRVRVLDTIEERSEEARFIPQQMCENHLGHYQQAAVEPTDNITRDKTKVG